MTLYDVCCYDVQYYIADRRKQFPYGFARSARMASFISDSTEDCHKVAQFCAWQILFTINGFVAYEILLHLPIRTIVGTSLCSVTTMHNNLKEHAFVDGQMNMVAHQIIPHLDHWISARKARGFSDSKNIRNCA